MLDPHGTRKSYQDTGCRCTPCRAANAQYQAAIRRLRAEGKLPLHATIAAGETWKMIKALRVEGVKASHLAFRLGLQNRALRFHTDEVSVKSYLKVRRLYRQLTAEGPDTPLDA